MASNNVAVAASASANASFFFSLLVLFAFSVVDVVHGNDYDHLKPQDCLPKCRFRCSATSHMKPCMFFCTKCCAECLCVPPGTSGNKELCPCYNNWKTKQGGPKCP